MAAPSTRSRGFSTNALRVPLVALGLFALFAGAVAGIVGGLPEMTPRILFAIGVLLIGIYVALDPEDVWSKLSGRGAVYSGNTLAIAAAALVILGLANVLASRYQSKIDFTANKQFTLSDQSTKIAQALSGPVKVTGYFTNSTDAQRRTDFQTLLSDYASRSDGKITYEFIDPEARPTEAIAAGITASGTSVYQMGDKKQQSTGTTENDISTALVKLERPSKKVYFSTGHGERSLDGVAQPDYSTIKQGLAGDSFTVATLNLLSAHAVPDDADEVVIGGPTNPFLPEELDALKAYADGGGKLILLVGPQSKTDLSGLLDKYGVAFAGNVVIDPAKSAQQDPRFVAIDSYGSHAITKDLRELTFFLVSTSITYPAPPASGGATVTVLAQSTDQSWGSSNLQQLQPKQDSDPKGPLALAVAIDAAGGASSSATPAAGAARGRIVLIGAPDMISNFAIQQVHGNQTFFLNAANWVAEQDALINIRPADTTPRTMTLIGWQMNLIALSSAALLPLAVLATGAAVWWTRR